MASTRYNRNKDGKIISATILVYKGLDKNGKRLSPYSETYEITDNMLDAKGALTKSAQKKLDKRAVQFEEECKHNVNPNKDAAKMRVYELAEEFLAAKEQTLSPTALGSYRHITNDIIVPTLGQIRLSKITSEHIQQFADQIYNATKLNSYGKPVKENTKVSPNTALRQLTVLQSMFSFALNKHYIAFNPVNKKALTLKKSEPTQIDIYTEDEIQKILEYANDEDLQFKALIYLAIFTGARRGELAALRFSDVDFKSGVMTISRSAYKPSGARVETKSTKSNKIRTLTLGNECLDILKTLAEQRKKTIAEWSNNDTVLADEYGSPLDPMWITRQFNLFTEKHQLPHRKFHSLRHCSATMLLANGADLMVVKERLGHSTIVVTERYLHLVQREDQKAANSLEKRLLKKRKK